ncbi:MAG: hypothetical protein DVB22_000119 [Verrucomicrobia bacterium]|nr:MAG: hypothetical protein DVB22_000119 [Verrucomicrobiota bacterium]
MSRSRAEAPGSEGGHGAQCLLAKSMFHGLDYKAANALQVDVPGFTAAQPSSLKVTFSSQAFRDTTREARSFDAPLTVRKASSRTSSFRRPQAGQSEGGRTYASRPGLMRSLAS